MIEKNNKVDSLEKRVKKLAAEKSRLQLLDELFRSFENVSRLNDVIDKILENALLLHGGMNIGLVYRLGNNWYRKDLLENVGDFEIVDNSIYSDVINRKTYYETEEPGDYETIRISNNSLKTKHKKNSYNPILDNKDEVAAILVTEGRLIDDTQTAAELKLFTNYCGIILKNAIDNELSLNKIRDEFSQIFDSNIDGILQSDSELKILRANRKIHHLFGCAIGTLRGRSISEIDPASGAMEFIKALRLENRASGETVVCFKNEITDHMQNCILSITPLKTLDNKISGYVFSYKDINQLKETENRLRMSEERFSLAMQGANDGLWDWNIQTGECFYSPRWKAILGYSDNEIINDFGVWKSFTETADLIEAENQIREIIEGRSERYEVELRMKHKDGHLVDVLSRGFLMKDENGQPLRLIGTHLDLSEIKQTENELRRAKDKAEENEQLKSNFLANMSHEVRTPMNGIIGFSRLLAEPECGNEKRKQYSDIVIKSCDRLLNVVNDILDISQLDSGQMVISKSRVELNAFIDQIFIFHREEAESKGLSLNMGKASEKKLYAEFDPNRIFQVFSNLITNAIKFTEKGQIEFGYSFVGEAHLKFYVSDTGVGIPEDARDKIYDRFYQRDASMTRSVGGNGLGLSISKKLTELHGSALKLESQVGTGSEFSFLLNKI